MTSQKFFDKRHRFQTNPKVSQNYYWIKMESNGNDSISFYLKRQIMQMKEILFLCCWLVASSLGIKVLFVQSQL